MPSISLSTICNDEDSAIDGIGSSTDSDSDSEDSLATDHAIAPTLRDLAQQFDSVGFDNIIFGRLSLLLSPYQHAHFRTIGSQWHGGRQRHGGAWVKQIYCKLLEISHNQWIFRCAWYVDAPPCGGWTQAQGKRDLEEDDATSLQPGRGCTPPCG